MLSKGTKPVDETAYLAVLTLIRNGVENTVCLYGSTAKEVFIKQATFQSLYNSKDNTRVGVIGTYKKTEFEVVAKEGN